MDSTKKLINLAKRTNRVVLISKGLVCGIVKNNFAGGSPAFNSFNCSLAKRTRTKINGDLK